MNKTLNPCDDFYNYACGSWDASYPMPSNQDVWNLEKIVEAEARLETKGKKSATVKKRINHCFTIL